MAGRAFSPGTVTIVAGGSVTFRNDDDREHTVTADDGAFSSGPIGEGGTWKRTFKQAGTFSYLCAIHPEMTGEVVVKGSGRRVARRLLRHRPPRQSRADPHSHALSGRQDDGLRRPDPGLLVRASEYQVPEGSTVTWPNSGAAPHTVTAEDGSFDSGMIAAGASWVRTFETVGTFRYVCSFHPQMEGVVEVTATQAAPRPHHRRARRRPRRRFPRSRTAATSAPEPALASVAARGGLPDGELFARIAIVGLLIGGALFLFARTVRGSADRAIDGEPQA